MRYAIKSMTMLIIVFAAIFFSCSRAAALDKIQILDGGVIEGYIIDENLDYVLIRRAAGDIQRLNKDMIDWIERGPAFEVEFKEKWDNLNHDADSYFDLGLWCEDRGHTVEANKCFDEAIKLNPDHQIAREKLGHMYYDGKWYEDIEKYYNAMGYVKYNGDWIRKEDKSKYEAGLVKQEDGTWISEKKLNERGRNTVKEKHEKSSRKPAREKSDKSEKPDKDTWQRQERDNSFYEDFSGSVPWESRNRFETKHYTIESNCSMKHIRRYANMLDRVYEKYVKVFGKPKHSGKSLVRIYASHQEFMQKERKPRGVGGFYGGGKVTAFHGKFGPTGSTQTVLFHECTHQFHDMVAGIRKAQIWFTEGLAVFFECSEIDEKGKIHIGVVNRDRLGVVQKGVKRGNYIKLDTLLSTPQSGFGASHYAYAWTVLYFLIYTNDNNRKLFNHYWVSICCGSGESRGSSKFREMIGIPLQEFEDCWKEWVLILNKDDLPEKVQEKSREFFKNYKK